MTNKAEEKETTMKSESLIKEIKAWDKEDVTDLRYLIDDLKIALNEETFEVNSPQNCHIEDHIDTTSLPSEPVPDDVTSYPVWAMDKKGHCLIGNSMNDVEHIAEIRHILELD